MKDYIKPIIRENNPEKIVLQIGTNDVNSSNKPTEIAEEIVDLANLVKTNNNNISISGLVPGADNINNKAEEVNEVLRKMCCNSSRQFINHSTSIKPNQQTNKNKLHLNRKSNSIFEKDFQKFLFNYY